MDFSLIASASSSLTAAVEIGKAAMSIRDAAKLSPELAKLQSALLDAQQALFRHNAELLALQQEHFKTAQDLRVAKETLADRGRYTLVEVSLDQWAYRVNLPPQQSGAAQPGQAQRPHYVCQACFDHGRKAVLQFGDAMGFRSGTCPVCRNTIAADLI